MKSSSVVSALIAMSVFASFPAMSVQKCDDKKQEVTPSSRFQDNGNGTITDTQTKVTWQRCVVGMTWDGSSCTGQSLDYKYSESHTVVDEYNQKKVAKHSNWRLPTEAELASIVESKCFNPTINLDVFPYTPQSGYWTSTEDQGLNTTRIRVMHFYNGNAYTAHQNQSWRIRLVANN